MGAIRAVLPLRQLSQTHPSCPWGLEGLRTMESSGKETGEGRLRAPGLRWTMGAPLICRSCAPPRSHTVRPLVVPLDAQDLLLSLQSFRDTTPENDRP